MATLYTVNKKIIKIKTIRFFLCPGPGKDGQNNAKTHLLVTFPPEKLKPKTKNYF